VPCSRQRCDADAQLGDNARRVAVLGDGFFQKRRARAARDVRDASSLKHQLYRLGEQQAGEALVNHQHAFGTVLDGM
jgi:hypothetical protein